MTIKNKKIQIILSTIILIIAFCLLTNSGLISCKNTEHGIEELNKYTELRNNMVDYQIISRGITDKKVIETMRKIPRHEFVDESLRDSAYGDRPLPISMGQTISQPYIVALMTESLNLSGKEKVLEIGTGSGYQAAVLAEIADMVLTVEIITYLHQESNKILSNYPNVETSNHDGYYGWEEHAPFDRIIVTAAPDHIPQPLVAQLADGGILIIPVGPPGWNQVLWKVEKKGGEIKTIKILDVVFVPLTREAE